MGYPDRALRCLGILAAALICRTVPGQLLRQETYVPAVDVQVLMPEPNGVQATAVATVTAGGAIGSIKLLNPGSGYGVTPWITVETPPDGLGATPILKPAGITEGKITEIAIEHGGSGYNPAFPPQVWIETPNRRAEARAVLSPDTLTHIEIIDPGSGYVPAQPAGFIVKFNPKKNAALTLGGDALVRFGLGSVGQRFPVLHGQGYSTLRGLPKPAQGDVMVRALGYNAPGDGGGGIFFWNPTKTFAMPRSVTVVTGGNNYRPGDVLLLNNTQRFLVTEINKRSSPQMPDGLYPDYMGVAPSGKVDVGAIAHLIPVEHRNFNDVPKEIRWTNSTAKWSESPNLVVDAWDTAPGRLTLAADGKRANAEIESVFAKRETIRGEKSGATGTIGELGTSADRFTITLIKSTVSGAFTQGERLLAVDGPGSGQPFVKGVGPLEIEAAWALDNGGSLINPCENQGRGRWERIYEDERNDIRFYGAVSDSANDGSRLGTDNSWPIQMAIVSWKAAGDPAQGKYIHIPGGAGGAFLTGPLNNNYDATIKGNGMLLGKPGQDVITTVLPPIDFPFPGRRFSGAVFEGFSILVNEGINPTATGGMADRHSYKARRLYKAARWDRERNSQRWGTMTFLEAERVSDRRYFGTDDSLDPEQAPPINDREPARRIYYVLNDTSAHERPGSLEFSDRVVALAVNPAKRGYARIGTRWSLDGGVPVPGSLSGPGKYGDKSNFGHPDAGKAQVFVAGLFVPESSEQGFTLSSKAASGVFVPGGTSRTPLLENYRYTFSLKGLVGADQQPVVFDSVCRRDPQSGKLVLLANTKSPPLKTDINATPALWIAGPVASVRLDGGGSYKYKPGEAPLCGLKSTDTIQSWEKMGQDAARLCFGAKPVAGQGFMLGMAVKGETSGASGMVSAFANDGTRETVALVRWDGREFKTGETIVPAFNTPGQLGVCLPAAAGEAPATVVFEVLFASDNPVVKPLSLTVSRGAGAQDTISLSAGGAAPNGKEYYPWRVVKVSGADGTRYDASLDFVATVDARGQRIVLTWVGEWPGKPQLARAPSGEYQVELLTYAGSPTFGNLPWPEWRALTRTGARLTFTDPHFLSARNGRIVTKGPDGLVTGSPWLEGRDYTVGYDEASGVGTAQWKTGTPPAAGSLYIQYRKAVDDYDRTPWGSPKHLSGMVQGAVLVDAYERFMGNFGFIQQSVNFPGYPPAVQGEVLGATFRGLWIAACGAVQSTSGAINIRHNYNGRYEDLQFRDTNYGLLMPVNLYYPWQNNGVRDDGSVMRRVPYSEGLAEFAKSWWGGDPSAGVGYYANKYQYLYAYGGGSEQCVFKGFRMRCGDIGIFVVGSAFYEVQNIWASGANSFDRPRGSTMFFGKPASGPEIFSNCMQFGPLERMFGEQALNGDYAIPAIRCCAPGGEPVNLSHVTQGRQAIWMGGTSGKSGCWRSSIFLDRGWKYGMGIWGPLTLRISTTAGSKQFAIDSVDSGPDTESAVPLRHGATYYFYFQTPGATPGAASFVYDATRPLNAQELKDVPTASVSNLVVRTHNSTMLKTEFNPIEMAKIHQHYGWTLLLCGKDNRIEVSPQVFAERQRLIREDGGRNLITDGSVDGPEPANPE